MRQSHLLTGLWVLDKDATNACAISDGPISCQQDRVIKVLLVNVNIK